MNSLYSLLSGVDHLVEKRNVYYKLNDEVQDDVLYAHQSLHESDVDDFVRTHAAKLIGCILISKSCWVVPAQIEAYISNNPTIDDCTFKRPGYSPRTPSGSHH